MKQECSQNHVHIHKEEQEHHDHSHTLTWLEGSRISLVFIVLLSSWLKIWPSFVSFEYVGFITAIIGGYPILKEAFSALIARKMTMELSMTIALTAALAIGELFTALLIIANLK